MNRDDAFKLPVFEILQEAILLPRKYLTTLLRFASPLLITYLLSTVYMRFIVGNQELEEIGTFIIPILFIVSLVLGIVGCHRTFLLEGNDVQNTKAFRWTGRETRYVGWWILISLCVVLLMLPAVLILASGMDDFVGFMFDNKYVYLPIFGVINVFAYYFLSRFSLILPATAIGVQNKTLSWAWNLSSGNGWRLTLLIGVIPFMTNLVFEFLPEFDSMLYSILVVIIWLVVGVIEIGLLSLSYSYLSKLSTEAPE